jgi:hypothetical protein
VITRIALIRQDSGVMTSLARRTVAISAALVIAGLSVTSMARPVAASSATTTAIVDEFGAGRWIVNGGSATLTSLPPGGGSGSESLRVAYDVSGGSLGLSPALTRADFAGLPRTVSLDVNGDGSWNVLYLQLRDATGEIFHYKLGNLSFRGWRTLSVHPGQTAPTATMGGDSDHVVDLPMQAFKIVLDRNGSQPATSEIDLDRLAVTSESWTPLRADSQVFVPSAGQSTTLRLGLAEAGDYRVVLTDEAARIKTWSGTTAGGADATFRWNGKSDAGAVMTGSVRARLTITRSDVDTIVDVPYLTGLAVRLEPSTPGSIVGINSTLTTINTVDRGKAESHARLMENAFVRMARETFDWNRVETRKGWFEWAKFDQAVEIAAAHQVELLGMLAYSASWASSAPAGATSPAFYPPKNTADFADYARAVVHRYKDRVHTWEVWNEENSATFWKSGVSAAGYAALLKATYAAIKAEDPTATVVFGGTVGFDRPFMDGIVAAGAWNSFDALAIHTYVAGQPETSMVVSWLDNAKAYVAAKGAKPIWITEFGWSTYAGSGSTYIGVSETRQAEYTARAYLHAAQVGVRGMFVYNLVELGTSTTSKLENFGLVDGAGRQKPAYAALRRVAEALDGATSAGEADPGATSRATVSTMDTTSGWRVAPLGGGSASLASSSTRHGGTAAVKVSYAFTSTSSGLELTRNLALAGRPTSVSVWVAGDGSANPVYLKIVDATGESFQGAIGALQTGWQRMTLHMDGNDTNWTTSGGDRDRVIDYPITVRSLFVFRSGIGKLSGSATFDDLQVGTGPSLRGTVLSRRGAINQALYSLGGTKTASVPVTGTTAYRMDGASATALSVSGGAVSVSLATLPINVLSYPAATSGPHAIRWISGDRTNYTFQVLAASGTVVRTVATSANADAGLRAAAWDGKVAGSPVAAGTYRLRLTVFGPDGRRSVLQKDVAIP